MTVEDLIQDNYNESDVPELLITENGHIEKICKVIFEHLDFYLKISFTQKKQKEIISQIEEDRNMIEVLTGITDNLLSHMISNIGEYQIDESENNKYEINPMWYLKNNKIGAC